MRRDPPSLVVARDAPHLGATYGIPGNFGCCFPMLRWVPNVLTTTDRDIPAARWIELNYVRVENVGAFLLLKPNPALRGRSRQTTKCPIQSRPRRSGNLVLVLHDCGAIGGDASMIESSERAGRSLRAMSHGYIMMAITLVVGLWPTPFLLRYLGRDDFGFCL